MMKKLTTLFLATLLFSASILQSGCFGEFAFVRAVYEWNDDVSDNEFVKTIVMYGLMIIPVYSIAGAADFLILNLIEFWSGSNPMSMNEGEEENQLVKYRGNNYQITASKNQLKVEQLSGKKKGAVASLVFDPQTDIWTVESNDQKIRIAKMLRNKHNKEVAVIFYQPNGEMLTVPYSDEGMAMIRKFAPNSEELVMN